jgi:hypothetical protein
MTSSFLVRTRTRKVKLVITELKRKLFTSKLNYNLTKKLVKCYTRSITLCGAKIGRFGNKSEILGKF